MTITALPTPAPSRTQTQAVFDAAYAAHIAALPTLVTEINDTAALLNAGAGMGAIAIPYTFSTTTTDADPGNGILRLNQATQNTATVIRADLLGSDAATYTAVLDTFDDTSGAIKGYIRLVKASDATKWLIFSVSALASPSGYKNITVANIGSSAANPFANSDAIMLYFTPLNVVNNSVGDHCVVVHTGNGHGSTNTQIRRFVTTMTNTGTSITYADSETLGATFTINDTGIYSITYMDGNDAGTAGFGLSVNSTELTTHVSGIAVANRLGYVGNSGTDYSRKMISITKRFVATDIIRPHSGTTKPGATEAATQIITITKIGL